MHTFSLLFLFQESFPELQLLVFFLCIDLVYGHHYTYIETYYFFLFQCIGLFPEEKVQ